MSDGLTIYVSAAGGAALGVPIGGAITFLGKLAYSVYQNWREDRKVEVAEKGKLVDKVVEVSAASGSAVAAGTKTMEQLSDGMITLGDRLLSLERLWWQHFGHHDDHQPTLKPGAS